MPHSSRHYRDEWVGHNPVRVGFCGGDIPLHRQNLRTNRPPPRNPPSPVSSPNTFAATPTATPPTPTKSPRWPRYSPAPDAASIREAMPYLIKALDNPDIPLHTFALTALIGLQTAPPSAPEAPPAAIASDPATPASEPSAPAATAGPAIYKPDVAKALTPYIPQIAALLTSEELQSNRLLTRDHPRSLHPRPTLRRLRAPARLPQARRRHILRRRSRRLRPPATRPNLGRHLRRNRPLRPPQRSDERLPRQPRGPHRQPRQPVAVAQPDPAALPRLRRQRPARPRHPVAPATRPRPRCLRRHQGPRRANRRQPERKPAGRQRRSVRHHLLDDRQDGQRLPRLRDIQMKLSL